MTRMTKSLIFRNLLNRSQATVIKSIDWKVFISNIHREFDQFLKVDFQFTIIYIIGL